MTAERPLAIDLYCGLGGWTSGLLAAGYDVIGFDLERHAYGDHAYPAQLVLQDVRTLHGSQFKNASLIVASPPCQKYSYMAMPWTRAKKLAEGYRANPETIAELNELFDACFRIQREASEAAGRKVPMVVENVRGAEPWVGRARWHYGSFYLWGDVPALMPIVKKAAKVPGFSWSGSDKPGYVARAFNGTAAERVTKNNGGSWFNIGSPGQKVTDSNSVHDYIKNGSRMFPNDCADRRDDIKCGGDWFNAKQPSLSRLFGSKSSKRKAASALIAKIPFILAHHIGEVYAGGRAPAGEERP